MGGYGEGGIMTRRKGARKEWRKQSVETGVGDPGAGRRGKI